MRAVPLILIVDDHPLNVDILQTCLSAEGYDTLTANDGDAALSTAIQHLPDLILLDVMMPKRDGIDVCRTLKGDAGLPFMPIILVTARIDAQDIVAGLEAGADEYLTKPVDQAALVARVRSMLRIKALQDQTQEQAARLEVQAAQLALRNDELTAQVIEEAKLAEIARLLGDIGHDVKNMMMPILMGVDLLDGDLKEVLNGTALDGATRAATRELSKEVCEMVRANSKRVQDRVKELADAVKGRSGPPHFVACDISKVVGAVLDTLRFYAEQNRVRLCAHDLELLPSIYADEGRLFNAFYNLVNNAIPETPAGGSVTVSGRFDRESEQVMLAVQDTGRGMPREVRDSLFSNRVISRKAGGTGLGTKIVGDAIHSHTGSITVDTEEGKGTTFFITLPLNPNKLRSPGPVS